MQGLAGATFPYRTAGGSDRLAGEPTEGQSPKGTVMNRAGWMALIVLTTWASGARAAGEATTIELTVKVPADAGRHVPVCATIELPKALAKTAPEAIGATLTPPGDAKAVPGQVVRDGDRVQLWWILPQAKAGVSRWTATLPARPYRGKDVFAFTEVPGKCLDLRFAGRLVTRHMIAFDTSTKAKAFETYKPYTHVFDAAGKDVITKDAHGHDPHHRGIYIGWGKTTCAGKRYNFWSMGSGQAQVHKEFLSRTAGPVLARWVARVDWQDAAGKAIVSERREMTCFRQPASMIALIEFRSELKAVASDVTLDANPEHGGFQYRAHNDVAVQVGATGGKQTADTAKADLKTRYAFHRDGIATGGQRLNDNKDLPWAAQSYALRGKRYCVQHMNHPSNPRPTVYSAYRPYGRFGAFFKTAIPAGKTLSLRYRLGIAESEMLPRSQMALRHAGFVTPPTAEATR